MNLVSFDQTNSLLKFFECKICLEKNVKIETGIILKTCSHIFCKDCLRNYIINSNDVLHLKCASCNSNLVDVDIQSVLTSNEFDKFQSKRLYHEEISLKNRFHCLTPNCNGFYLVDNESNNCFVCSICTNLNCVKCKKLHSNKSNCDLNANLNESESVEDLLKSGLIMRCPNCNILIEKADNGCQAVRCFYCKIDICWLTKQRRWGDGGKGDISGGCKCGVNGLKCHPDCQNCH